jgi:predicted nucleotidyltransferase
MIKLVDAIVVLAGNGVDFVVVGGMAIRSHGSSYLTEDLDICYSREDANLQRLATSLRPLNPRPRNFPDDLPFIWDESTLRNATHFTLTTSIGNIDLLGEVSGIGGYREVFAESVAIQIENVEVRILSIDGLIKAKTAAGRPKDIPGLKELEALKQALEDED